jgi:hypothetical protein
MSHNATSQMQQLGLAQLYVHQRRKCFLKSTVDLLTVVTYLYGFLVYSISSLHYRISF